MTIIVRFLRKYPRPLVMTILPLLMIGILGPLMTNIAFVSITAPL